MIHLAGDGPTGVLVRARAAARLRRPEAGDRVVLPGEHPPAPSHLVHGGTAEADAELGRRLWPHLLRLLGPGSNSGH